MLTGTWRAIRTLVAQHQVALDQLHVLPFELNDLSQRLLEVGWIEHDVAEAKERMHRSRE
jgi:hypothetical protein